MCRYPAKAALLALTLSLSQVHAQSPLEHCTASTFASITLFGGVIQDITALPHSNLSFGPDSYTHQQNFYPVNITELSICAVSITYTHPGYDDSITTITWLPTSKDWNGRFLGVGGGGWGTGLGNLTLARPSSEGYAATLTDGGHSMEDADSSPQFWGLKSEGNIDWALLQDYASIALDDAATLGKAVTKAFYGRGHGYAYYSGCSTGGRQGHMLAQRYAGQYDGILAACPGFNWNEVLLAMYWPQLVMNEMGEFGCLSARGSDAICQIC
jgi:hypothetical protein